MDSRHRWLGQNSEERLKNDIAEFTVSSRSGKKELNTYRRKPNTGYVWELDQSASRSGAIVEDLLIPGDTDTATMFER